MSAPHPSRLFKYDPVLSQTWVRVIRTLASRRERGELGQGRVRAALRAAWMPLTRTGWSPGTTALGLVVSVGEVTTTL
jgi:hypothetical protein